jgi:hypothetical protein
MIIKTSELAGAALDWAVAKAEGILERGSGPLGIPLAKRVGNHIKLLCEDDDAEFSPSIDWAQGGPIIERELFSIEPFKARTKDWRCFDFRQGNVYAGPTPLIAAMRCYVASRLGDEIDVPEELI